MTARLSRRIYAVLLFIMTLCPALLYAVVDPPAPSATTLTAPTGTLTDRQPEFSWQAVANATWYKVWINRDGEKFFSEWIEGAVTWQPDENLPAGSYTWWVQTWGPGGTGPWSAAGTFEIEAHIPGPATPAAPSGLIDERQPVFSWNAVTHATWYHVWINLGSTEYFSGWVDGVTSWQPAENMPPGSYTWWVRTWGPDGIGPWSDAESFEAESHIPGAATLNAPSGLITDRQPTFQWDAVNHATWYKIHIDRNGTKLTTDWIEGETNWSPANPLAAGNFSWWIMTWSEEDAGPWSAEKTFTIEPVLPGSTSLIDPADVTLGPDAAERRPWFSWTPAVNATWYRLHLYRDGDLYGKYWAEGVTTWRPASALPGGVFTWKVEGWNEDGYGPLSAVSAFTVAVSEYHTLEQRAHQLVNEYRDGQLLSPLAWNETIAQVCRGHSQNMASGSVPFGHAGAQARVDQIGLVISWVSAGENVAWNQGYAAPADTAVAGWIESPGHNSNMTGNFNKTGMGVARGSNGSYYFTQIFILD